MTSVKFSNSPNCRPNKLFLHNKVDDVIAGTGGLLIVNGGLQPKYQKPITPPAIDPPAANQDPANPETEIKQPELPRSVFLEQPILVCNPLTRVFKFLPQHSPFGLKADTARMVLIQNPGDWRKQPVRKQQVAYRRDPLMSLKFGAFLES